MLRIWLKSCSKSRIVTGSGTSMLWRSDFMGNPFNSFGGPGVNYLPTGGIQSPGRGRSESNIFPKSEKWLQVLGIE